MKFWLDFDPILARIMSFGSVSCSQGVTWMTQDPNAQWARLIFHCTVPDDERNTY